MPFKTFFFRNIFLVLKITMAMLLWAPPKVLQAKKPLKIVVTTSIIGDALYNITGNAAQIIPLMGPGVDPHAYKATPNNIRDLVQADIVFYNGLHLEGKMADILEKFRKKKPVYAASDGIDSSAYLGDLSFMDGVDPHIWFDVQLWKEAIEYMSAQLQKHTDMEMTLVCKENTLKYLAELDKLHLYIKDQIRQIPTNQRVLITAHDAFAYFGRAYNIEVKGLQGISTIGDCGLRDITDLVNFIVQSGIKAIFPENSVPDKPLRAVLSGCQKRNHNVVLGEELYSDALGKPGTEEGTYIGMVNKNVNIIVNALK